MVRSARRRFNLVSSVVSHGYGNGPVAALIAILLGDTATSKHVIRIFEAKTFVHGLGLLVVTPFRIAYIYIYMYFVTSQLENFIALSTDAGRQWMGINVRT